MNVRELNDDQIMVLKSEMYYGTDDYAPLYEEYDYIDDIPFGRVDERYDGILFVEDDFGI